MRSNVTKLLVGFSALAVVSGCDCGTVTQCEDIFVSFESPKDGATGVPATTDVTVKVTDNAGQAIDLDSATLVSRSTSATEFSVPRDGTVTSGKATFTGVTLEPGPNLIKVTVKKKGSACTGNKSVTVEVPASNDPPKVLTVSFPQDTAMPTGTLNSVELPTTAMLRVDLTTQFALGGTVELINTANNMVLGTASISNAAVSVQVPSAGLADGAYVLFAKITKGSLSNTQTANPDAVKMISLDRTPPTCMVTAPTAMVLGPTGDADSTKAGYQLRTTATASAKATTLEIKLTGGATPQTSGPQTPVAMAVSRDFDVPSTGTVAYTVTAEAKDSAGNLCTATKTVTVDFDCPTLTIASPDGGVETTFNVPIVANVSGGNGGTVDWKVTDTSGTRDLGILPTANGVSSGVGSFINGAQTISAQATDAVGNVCAPVTRAFSVNATTGCSVVFTRPSTRPGFITVGAVSGGNYSFQASSTCANGTPAVLKRNGTVIATQNVTNGAVSWNVPVTSGMFTFRAEVGSAPVVFDSIDVTIDLTAPAITQPVDLAILNSLSDVAPGTAGLQSGLAYNATIPVGGRADVCSNQTPAPGGSTPCPDGAAGWWTLKASVPNPDPTLTYPEGSYCLKLVVVSGTTTNVSQQVCIVVDSIVPTVVGLTLLRDAAPGDKKLNLAELNGMPPEFQFTVGAGHTQSMIKRVQILEGTTVFSSATASSFSGAMLNVVNIKADQGVTTTTQTYNWTIEIEDLSGNVGTSAVQVVKIDKVAPTCAITAPTAATLGRPDDQNMGTAAFDLKVDATGSADTANITFSTTGGQALTQMVAATSGNATNTFALTQATGVTAYSLGATCVDDSGNSTAAPAFAVSIDLDPPTCALTAPVASPPQYTQFAIPTSVTVGGPGTVGRTVAILSQVGAGSPTQVGTLSVNAGGVAAGSITYLNGVQTVTARVTDPVGNVCTTPGVSIDITSAACAISILTPVIGPDGNAYFTSGSITVTGNSSNCGAGKAVDLIRVGTGTLGSGTTDASGNVSINGTLPEGGPYTLRLHINNGSGMTTDTDLTNVYVDLTPPTAGAVELNAVAFSSASVTFVAADNANRLPPTPNPAFVQDVTPGGDAQFNLKVSAVIGAIGGRVRVVYGGTERATAPVTTSPQDVLLNNVTLTHNTTGTFAIEVIDAAGLTLTKLSIPGAVDVIEPAAPTVTRTLTDGRLATVSLGWMPTYDDLSNAASGGNAGYEIRWSTSAVTNNNLLATETDYLDSAKARPESNEAWSAAAIVRPITVPPNNTYYIAVRARDEVGNYSAYSAPAPLNNLGTTSTLANPSGLATDSYGVTMAGGPITGDAIDDLVVGGSGSAKVYVYVGGPGFTTQGGCSGLDCQTIDMATLPGVTRTPATETFGNSLAVGNVTNGASAQLVVGSANFNSTQGRAFLFFGGANADGGVLMDPNQFVEFRGDGGQFGRHVGVVPDINGDGFNEVSVTARSYNSNRGRLYLFKGRSKAAWQAAASGGAILEGVADWIIEGPSPAVGGNNNFSPQLSQSGLGQLTGGPGNDIAFAAAHENVNSVYLMSSATMGDGGIITTGTGAIPAQQFQTITRTPTAGPVFTAFGGAVVGNVDVTGAVAKDLIITNVRTGNIFVYGDGTPASFGNPVISIQGENSMTNSFTASDLTGDGKLDFVAGEAAPTGGPNRVFAFYNRSNSYDTVLGGFFQSVLTGTSTTSGFFGLSLTKGDFDGDTKVDIAIADTATPPGRVVIWR